MTGAARVDEIVWSSRFRVHHQVADRYRAGRILLAGDAAHVHSPAGGQGMNTGIQDAVALGHALAAVLGGRAGDSRLDQYERAHPPTSCGASGGLHRPDDADGDAAHPPCPGGAQRRDEGDRSDPRGTSLARH